MKVKKEPSVAATGSAEKKEKPTAATGTPQRKPSNLKQRDSSHKSGGERLPKHHSRHQNSQHQQASASTPSTDRFALSSYQTAPDAAEVPRPSLSVIANAKQAKCSWVPRTLPVAPVVEAPPTPPSSAFLQASELNDDNTTQEMTANLMKMLGIGQLGQ